MTPRRRIPAAGVLAMALFAACATGRGPEAMPSAAIASPSAAPATPSPVAPATPFVETGAPMAATTAETASGTVLFNDSHFHLLNYVQRGPAAREFLEMTDGRVGRVAMFGIPLQQKWDYFLSGDRAPDYYLRSNADLYYYSFVDAVIAREYLSLPEAERGRVDPMITGFNPTDMYSADHIERVLLTFPGVFAGIGEFSIHKEFVSSKVSGHAASLRNPALDRILDTAAEIGLVVILHCDIDNVRPGDPPDFAAELLELFADHPDATIIWAHTGLGRFIAPAEGHVAGLDRMLADPLYDHIALDISWDEVAKYVVRDEASLKAWTALIERHPTRFLFGTDAVAPTDWDAYVRNHAVYAPLWQRLDPAVRAQVERLNYERIFDAAIPRVRAWEERRLTGRNGS
ncbi:amidohydrolase family protein [Candidatus Palauibacter polyketidifaciens]|uniref:amidohydrolase family protein n=1 Tax=Candidatus Palauibacter polyketidifaciens TaxID=3056740 RepID=UPI00238DCB4E|nr:amidohydrolase family protein [Candidatus Palauibacter polyketidifaciens]MDE2720444.1 amidohydrolase [Candidatus Palauibacter polyketidifaciens]